MNAESPMRLFVWFVQISLSLWQSDLFCIFVTKLNSNHSCHQEHEYENEWFIARKSKLIRKWTFRVSVLDHFRTETLTFSWIELFLSGTVLSHKDCIGSSAVAADHRKPARFHVWTPIDWKREAILPNITKTQTRMLSPSKKTNSDIESWTWISDVESWIDTRPPRAVFYFETRLLTSALHPKTWNSSWWHPQRRDWALFCLFRVAESRYRTGSQLN